MIASKQQQNILYETTKFCILVTITIDDFKDGQVELKVHLALLKIIYKRSCHIASYTNIFLDSVLYDFFCF